MKQSIYLHRQIVDVLNCYGDLNTVVNRILQEAANGKFDIMHKPPCPGRDGAGRYEIDITEPSYLELLSVYGPFSSKISIRRVIYWFIENEMYDEFGWEPIQEFRNRHFELLQSKISNSISELEKATRYAIGSTKNTILDICNQLKSLQEYLKND
jgi:hypothetical protein